ncbi:MAG: GTP-binding protein, partial [Moraxellaceae bacterium]|nr:GTP-binding protein [Moraxellaceae bacterium]
EDDMRTVTDLLIEQVEFADVILISKTDLAAAADVDALEAVLRTLNREARILRMQGGQANLDDVLDTRLFDFERAQQAPGWLQEMRGEHQPETDAYGIASFTYQARRPFHPQRFWNFLHQHWSNGRLLRSKGYFWLASRPALAGTLSQAGGILHHGVAGHWWAAVDDEHWPEDEDSRARILEKWDGEMGDCRQELVFIGQQVNAAQVRAELDACLLTDDERAAGAAVWAGYSDPFPAWDMQAA